MFGKAKLENFNVWKSQNPEFQSLEKLKSRVPVFEKPNSRILMFGKAKIKNTNVKKSQNPEFQCLEKQDPEFNCFEKAKRLNSESIGHEAEDRMGY